MKVILSILLFLSIFSLSWAQEKFSNLDEYMRLIESKAYNVQNDEYYLVKRLVDNFIFEKSVRRINDEFVIVKGSNLLNAENVGEKYLLNNVWKLSYNLRKSDLSSSKKYKFSVKYSADAEFTSLFQDGKVDLIRNISSANVAIILTSYKTILKNLIHNHNIEYVDFAQRSANEESPLRQFMPELSRINTAKHNYPHLDGNNMTISLKENSINDEDIDLAGKVMLDEKSSTEFTQHAKEMGTFIAGAGNSFKTGEGVVKNASIVCTDFNSLFAEDITYYNAHNVKVQNHSYGTGIENLYGNESITYDQVSVDIPELMHFFSAGNEGVSAPQTGTYGGLASYGNLTGSFKQAKNVMVIAALDSTMNHVAQTSSGPAYDGRIKPELAAFGGEGTSEAAAIASGAATMIQNHYSNVNGNLPISSMTKSLMIAGANEADIGGIDFRTGYGSINLNRSLQLVDSGWYVQHNINSNSNYSFQIEVPSNISELKVVLSWIDPPANAEDAFALVNDLDMTIVDPSTIVWQPWVLNSSPSAVALASEATRGEDHLNNVEMISMDNPENGLHTVSINSQSLLGNNQTFCIAYCMKIKDKFEWSFPTGSDHLEANTVNQFRWENTYSSQTSDLSIRYGNGDWQLIGSPGVSSEQFKYILKDTMVYASLKMDIEGTEYISDIFTVSKPLVIQVENDCTDEFILSWDKHENTESYELFELQSNELISVLTTIDTLVKLDKSVFDERYYAVRPIQDESLDGLRSFSINYANQNKGCYITSFLAFLDVEGFTNIQLSINVPFDIEQISILKAFGQSTEVFQQFSPDGNISFQFEDTDLLPGRQVYQAQLTLKDGATILSEALDVFYTDSNTVIAFPNPVHNDDFVTILNDYIGGVLQLIDDKGNFVKDYDLVSATETIDLIGINKGVYFYRIIFDTHIVDSGRIVRL